MATFQVVVVELSVRVDGRVMGLTKKEIAAGLDYKHARRVKLPALAIGCLAHIPDKFIDDGCSRSPDSIFGFDFRWGCRIHDHWYCTRAHPAGTMTKDWQRAGDRMLRRCVSASLPWRWRWVAKVYYAGVKWFGHHAFDTCGDPDEPCRHGMTFDDWAQLTFDCDRLRSAKNLDDTARACWSDWNNENRIDRACAEFEDRLRVRYWEDDDVEQEARATTEGGGEAASEDEDS